MTNPCIICVAITGSLPTKDNNLAVPITITEQIESTHEAFEKGASIVHAHVRDDDGKPTSDPERFARLKEGIENIVPARSYNYQPVAAPVPVKCAACAICESPTAPSCRASAPFQRCLPACILANVWLKS
jgi:hypothetical protein